MNPLPQDEYRPRTITCLELWQPGTWQIKFYGIAYDRPSPDPGLVRAARRLFEPLLINDAARTHHYALGFAGAHQGRGADFVFLGWWADENELHYRAFAAPSGQWDTLRPTGAPAGPLACVWDVAVIAHERDAWLGTILSNPAGADAEAYLKRQLNGSF